MVRACLVQLQVQLDLPYDLDAAFCARVDVDRLHLTVQWRHSVSGEIRKTERIALPRPLMDAKHRSKVLNESGKWMLTFQCMLLQESEWH